MARPARARIIHDLRLDAIAAVDLPCQEGATMRIMKRDPKGPARPEPESSIQIAKTAEGFEHAVEAIMDRDNCSRLAALSKAADRYPEALAAFRKARPEPVDDSGEADDRLDAREVFAAKVESVLARNPAAGRAAAMSKAAREHPREFEAAYS